MRSRINTYICAALMALLVPLAAFAKTPSVAELDTENRAAGNRMEIARAVGEKIFSTQWPAQIFRVSANGIGPHVVIGLGLYGVKFHRPLTRAEFAAEIAGLIQQSFAVAPSAEEVDVWTVVPITVGKGVIVNGDLAKPTTRTVFTATVMRTAAGRLTPAEFINHPNVYWDEDWTHTAFKEAP